MPTDTVVRVCVDGQLKKAAGIILASMGLTLSNRV